jgi:hypothetical protein
MPKLRHRATREENYNVIVLFCSQVNYKNSSERLAARRRRRINGTREGELTHRFWQA